MNTFDGKVFMNGNRRVVSHVVLSYKHCCCPEESGLQNSFVICVYAVKIVLIDVVTYVNIQTALC